MHWHLVISFQENKLGENFGAVEEGGNVGDVRQWVVVWLSLHVEAPIVSTGAEGTVLLYHYVQRGCPGTWCLLRDLFERSALQREVYRVLTDEIWKTLEDPMF